MATSTIKGIVKKETTLSGTYINGSWRIKRVGDIVFLQVEGLSSPPAGAFTLGATVPEEYRPSIGTSFTLVLRRATTQCIALTIGADGAISVYNYGSAISGYAQFHNNVSWTVV